MTTPTPEELPSTRPTDEVERLREARELIASYFDGEDAEYTTDEIRSGAADHIIRALLAEKANG